MRGLWFPFSSMMIVLGCGVSAPPPGPSPSPGSEAGTESGGLSVLETPVSFTIIGESVVDDPEVEATMAPFRIRMGEEIKEVIGETASMLSKAKPEGTLGNFATDAMLWAANERLSVPAHMALTNNGGLRVPIGPGPITVEQMYELMPFENLLSLLTLSGSQVQTLCDQLAEVRGEPIAGFSFRIQPEGDTRVARDILISGEPLDLEAEYRLVTNDFLASGGGNMTPLHSPMAREDLPVLLRDAFIDYVKHVGVIEPGLEGRITGGIGR